jgi:hypothetical protein
MSNGTINAPPSPGHQGQAGIDVTKPCQTNVRPDLEHIHTAVGGIHRIGETAALAHIDIQRSGIDGDAHVLFSS